MKTVIFILLDQWADWEAAYLSSAIRMFGQDQYAIKTVSLTLDPVESMGGFRVLPDYDISNMPEDYEALILNGGMTWRNEDAQKIKPLAEACVRKGRVLGGICDASAFLGKIGLLNHVKHTSNDLNDLKKWADEAYTGDENYCLQQSVSDKNIITANGTATLEFAKNVMLALGVAPEEKISEWYDFHKRGLVALSIGSPADSSAVV